MSDIILDEFSDFILFSYFLGLSRDNFISSCDNINRLLYKFNSFRNSLNS